MATVKFTDLGEFLEELEPDADKIDRNILRVTYRTVYGSPLTTRFVIASAVVAGHVVRLQHPIGSYMFAEGEEYQKVVARGEKAVAELKDFAARKGLTVRAGVFGTEDDK